jgi:hypothetical protein
MAWIIQFTSGTALPIMAMICLHSHKYMNRVIRPPKFEAAREYSCQATGSYVGVEVSTFLGIVRDLYAIIIIQHT